MKRFDEHRGVLALLAVTLIWGTTFPTMKLLAGQFSAMQIIALRFAIAVLVLSPLLLQSRQTEWRWGLGLGMLLFLAFALQIEGLTRTSSNRNAFITGLNVLLVPLMGLVLGQRPAWNLWLACLLALAGVRSLFWSDVPWNPGDSLTLASTVFYALYIHALSAAQQPAGQHARQPLRSLHLTALQGLVLLLGSVAVLHFSGQPLGVHRLLAASGSSWLAVLHLGLVASIGGIALQAWGQRHVSATPSAVIYGLEPVFAALTALVLLDEQLAPAGLLGGALIVAALVLSQLRLACPGPGSKAEVHSR